VLAGRIDPVPGMLVRGGDKDRDPGSAVSAEPILIKEHDGV
jgi:hypothetical protein